MLRVEDITKSWGRLVANDKVNLNIQEGEVHALLGENGAGKTTLVKIIAGLVQPDSGRIVLNGRSILLPSRAVASKLGIEIVPQHLELVEGDLTVLGNLILGAEPRKGSSIDYKAAKDQLRALCRRYGFEVSLDAEVRRLSLPEKQRVQILKALFRQPSILILDEPTTLMDPRDVQHLGELLKELTKEGRAVILISHKIPLVLEMADQITVLRKGRVISTCLAKQTRVTDLASQMVGGQAEKTLKKANSQPGSVAFQTRNLRLLNDDGLRVVENLSIEVREGEVVAVVTLENSLDEIAQAIVGLRPTSSGEILLDGQSILGLNTREIRDRGVTYIPSDRRRVATIAQLSLNENLALTRLRQPPFSHRGTIVDWRSLKAEALRMMDSMRIQAESTQALVRTLSGGNLQKVVIARELAGNPRLIIACRPTAGLDVQASRETLQALLEARRQGTAILLLTSDWDEVAGVADRAAILVGGQIQQVVSGHDCRPELLSRLMMGGATEGR